MSDKQQIPDFSKLYKAQQDAMEKRKFIQELSKQASEVMKKFAEDMQVDLHGLNIKEIGGAIKATSDDVEKFKLIMIEMGYPPHYDLEIPQIRKIAQDYEKNGIEQIKEQIEQFLVEQFNKEALEKILNKWTKLEWLQNRLHILTEGIEAHNTKSIFHLYQPSYPKLRE